MNERFGHNFTVHVLGLAGPLFLGYLAYRSSVDQFVAGGIALRIALVSVCVVLAIAVFALYLRSGIQRYEVTDSGLVIRHPWGRVLVPWPDIRNIDWNIPLHYIVFRGASSVITFTSIDFFPRILDFLRIVHERSNCSLSTRLERIIHDYTRNA